MEGIVRKGWHSPLNLPFKIPYAAGTMIVSNFPVEETETEIISKSLVVIEPGHGESSIGTQSD